MVFNILRFLFLKRHIFCAYPQSQSFQADLHTLATSYAQTYLLGSTIATFGPVQIIDPSTTVPVVMHILQHCAGGRGQKEEFAVFTCRNHVHFFA